MSKNLSAYRGCLLGLAVGDAMGCAVDSKTLEEIRADYGPNGLLGYDLVNGCADVTSYTQLAAFVANGLLLGVSRGKTDYLRFITLSLREWARNQNFHRDPEKSYCWVAKPRHLRLHLNRDARMLDALRAQTLGTPEAPINRNAAPGALTTAVAIGLFFEPRRMEPAQVGTLAAQTVALTHGDPEAFLSAAVLAYSIAGILQEPERPLAEQFTQAAAVMQGQFRDRFAPQAELIAAQIKRAVAMAETPGEQDLEALECISCPQVLAGAVYASLTCSDDFDAAMITAVNHSGLSAAVGAVTGAVLGAKLGMEALPEFYLESLSAAPVLEELADDLALGNPAMGLFNDDWDHKYIQGLPLRNT